MRMITEATEMRDNVGISYKVRGINGRWTIAATEMRDNRDVGYGDTGIWRRRQRQRCGTGNRIYAGTTKIAIFGRRLRWAYIHHGKGRSGYQYRGSNDNKATERAGR